VADLDAVLRGLMKDIGAVLRPHGFRGSGGVWRLITAEGVAVVQKQGSVYSPWAEKVFFVNTAIIPVGWWKWENVRSPTRPIEKATEASGARFFEGRIRAETGDEGWHLTATTDVDRLRAHLVAGVANAAPRLVELLAPGRYLEELRALPDKGIGGWRVLAALLAWQGPSRELDEALAGLRTAWEDRPGGDEYVQRLAAWARTRG
jgi:hypothetical protein